MHQLQCNIIPYTAAAGKIVCHHKSALPVLIMCSCALAVKNAFASVKKLYLQPTIKNDAASRNTR